MPPRIAALSPGIAQVLADAGLSHLIVARHGFDRWSDPALPVCGDQSGIDYEALLRVQPTHVLLQWGARDLPPRLAALAKSQKWIVRDVAMLSLEQVRTAANEIEAEFGAWATPAGGEKSRGSAALEHALKPIDRAADAGRVLILYGTSPPTVLGPGSYHHEMLVSLGGVPAITRGSPFITLDAEDLIRIDPDVIIAVQPRVSGETTSGLARHGEAAKRALGGLARLPLKAVKAERCYLIDDPRGLLPGTNLARVARAIGDCLRRSRTDDDSRNRATTCH